MTRNRGLRVLRGKTKSRGTGVATIGPDTAVPASGRNNSSSCGGAVCPGTVPWGRGRGGNVPLSSPLRSRNPARFRAEKAARVGLTTASADGPPAAPAAERPVGGAAGARPGLPAGAAVVAAGRGPRRRPDRPARRDALPPPPGCHPPRPRPRPARRQGVPRGRHPHPPRGPDAGGGPGRAPGAAGRCGGGPGRLGPPPQRLGRPPPGPAEPAGEGDDGGPVRLLPGPAALPVVGYRADPACGGPERPRGRRVPLARPPSAREARPGTSRPRIPTGQPATRFLTRSGPRRGRKKRPLSTNRPELFPFWLDITPGPFYT